MHQLVTTGSIIYEGMRLEAQGYLKYRVISNGNYIFPCTLDGDVFVVRTLLLKEEYDYWKSGQAIL